MAVAEGHRFCPFIILVHGLSQEHLYHCPYFRVLPGWSRGPSARPGALLGEGSAQALPIGHGTLGTLSKAVLFCFVFRAPPKAYGGPQARGLTGTVGAGLHQSHSNAGEIQATSVTYTTAHGNARSLAH